MINNFNNTTVAITGGAGLIGSYLVDNLLTKYSKVVVIDDFSTGQFQNIKNVADDLEIREGNLENPEFCKNAFKGCDHIFHLASRAFGIGYSENNQIKMLIHNERITNNLIESLKFSNVDKVLITSSSCVYDDNGPDVTPELPVFLNDPEFANRGYGWAKRFLEAKSSILSNEIGLKTIIVRPYNVYGERYKWRGEYSHTIPMLISKVFSKNNPVEVWGSGRQRRSYLHALDCAFIMEKLFDTDYTKGPVNIGLDKTISIKELAVLISEQAEINTSFSFNLNKPEGRFIKSSDIKLQQSLIPDFTPKITLNNGVLKMIDWYKKSGFK